jgi:hypothetical protein
MAIASAPSDFALHARSIPPSPSVHDPPTIAEIAPWNRQPRGAGRSTFRSFQSSLCGCEMNVVNLRETRQQLRNHRTPTVRASSLRAMPRLAPEP